MLGYLLYTLHTISYLGLGLETNTALGECANYYVSSSDAALALELQEAEEKKKQPDGFGWQDRQKKQRHNTTPLLPSDGTRRDPLVLRGHTAPPDETSPRTLREIVDEQLAEHIGGQEAVCQT